MSKEFGENLRKLRKDRGLTQKQVADMVPIDRSTYAYYECGTTEPSIATIQKLSKVLRVPVTMLFGNGTDALYAQVSDSKCGLGSDGSLQAEAKDESLVLMSKDEEEVLKWYRGLNIDQLKEFVDFKKHINENK